jgi:hypothetical protein
VAKHIGIPFVGMKWLKIVVRGIVKYVRPAGIGGNGIVKNVTGAPMGSHFLANVVAGESVNLLMIKKEIELIVFFPGHFLKNCVCIMQKL